VSGAERGYAAPPFAPLEHADGYLPLEDHGLIGDGATAALVGRDGAISWLCLPRFDSPPVFCSILDHQRGGRFLVAPENPSEARQRYEPDSGVLTTEMRSPTGLVRVTDALMLRRGADLTEDVTAARGELLRSVVVLDGEARVRISVEPRGGASASRRGDGLQVRCHDHPDLDLQLSATAPLEGLDTILALRAGEEVHVGLRWGRGRHRGYDWRPAEVLQGTLDAWRAWMHHFSYVGPNEPLVRRSAITLKLLDHFASGAIVAAPTSSLPEVLGGLRNWDYRYTWVRDAAFSVYALRRIGLDREAWGFLGWVLDAIEGEVSPV
jgi:GH15 family glucan-1,4-alpha-glucosidase